MQFHLATVIVLALAAPPQSQAAPAEGYVCFKTASALYPAEVVRRLRANVAADPWCAQVRDRVVEAARPWLERTDDELWNLMFGPGIKRSWMVWSNGFCPACKTSVPMYTWKIDALKKPWKTQCPHCSEIFPKNDFAAFYRSGLNQQGLFDPAKADRSLLFNVEHSAENDPLRSFGVDDGGGYMEGENRWRFIGAYLIYGQWKQAVVSGIRLLSSAHLLTGDPVYAHKAALMLDRVADFYPLFDYAKQAVTYERELGSAGYVSVWHDACEETRELTMAYDLIFEAAREDETLVQFLSEKAAAGQLENPKRSFADIQRNIEQRILHDAIVQRPKITSNYPRTEITVALIHHILGGEEHAAAFRKTVDAMLQKATAVDGITGEKGLAGYATFTISGLSMFLAEFSKADPDFLPDLMNRFPSLRQTFRFHIDTHCLDRYYPTCGDAGAFAATHVNYAAMPLHWSSPTSGGWTCLPPKSYSLLWRLYQATGDVAYLQTMYRSNGNSVENLPRDPYVEDAQAIRKGVQEAIDQHGATIKLSSVNKKQWHLALLRSGEGSQRRVLWLDYDSGGQHGHTDAMNLGLFARGLDLMPDFGYPPVQYGGWDSPRALWYKSTPAHCTVVVDGKNAGRGAGLTTLWADGKMLHAIRAVGGSMNETRRFERTAVLVDLSPDDFYAVDVFRVAGGAEQVKFAHSHFGSVSTGGLRLEPGPDYGHGTQMRNLRVDTRPSPGWHADWDVQDLLKLREDKGPLHVRFTDFTPDAQAGLTEAWIALGQYNQSDEQWIPRVFVRRQATEGKLLESTFVSVIEPYGAKRALTEIRRVKLNTQDGAPASDAHVGLELLSADGQRDLLIVRDPDDTTVTELQMNGDAPLSTDAELCMVRSTQGGQATYAAMSLGSRATLGSWRLDAAADRELVEWPE